MNLAEINNKAITRTRRLSYVAVHAMVMDDPSLSLLQQAVLNVLLRHANYGTFDGSWPSVATIAERVRHGTTQTRYALRALQEKKWISPTSSMKGGRKPTEWKLNVAQKRQTRPPARRRAGPRLPSGQAPGRPGPTKRSTPSQVPHQARTGAPVVLQFPAPGSNPDRLEPVAAVERWQ
jgi:hypothetical protein